MSFLDEHMRRMNDIMDTLDTLEMGRRKRAGVVSLCEYQVYLTRKFMSVLYKLDLGEHSMHLPSVIPYDAHLTKTPWWRRMLGNHSTYVEFDDSGSKTIS